MRPICLLLAATFAAAPAHAASGFPFYLTAEEVCFPDEGWCTSQSFELYEDGTFSDGEAWTGTWIYSRRVGPSGGLQLRYDPWFGWDYVYQGFRTDSRIDGDVMAFDGTVVGWFTLRCA